MSNAQTSATVGGFRQVHLDQARDRKPGFPDLLFQKANVISN